MPEALPLKDMRWGHGRDDSGIAPFFPGEISRLPADVFGREGRYALLGDMGKRIRRRGKCR